LEVIILFGVLILLIFIGVPIAFSMGITGVVVLLIEGVPLDLVPQRMFSGLSSFTLVAVPLFIFVGELMNTGGITTRIFNFCRVLVGHIKGGLAHVNVLASIIFAGMSGSALSDAYGLGITEIKIMKEAGFDIEFSAAVTGASSVIGPIIPPSIPMVIYAVISEQSVGRLFLGGIVPGLLMGLSLMVLIYIISSKRKYPIEKKRSFKEALYAAKNAFPSLMTPVILLGGIVLGIVTPTEGAAITVLYAILLGIFIHRELKLRNLYEIMLRTVKNSASVLIIISSASVITWFVTISSLPNYLSNILLLTNNKFVVLLLINIFLLVLGCFLEGVSIILIVVPLLLPTIMAFNINPIHFGVVLVLNVMLGALTPPFGLCLFAIAKVSELPIIRVAKAISIFLIPLLFVLLLITYFPDVVLFFPNIIMGK